MEDMETMNGHYNNVRASALAMLTAVALGCGEKPVYVNQTVNAQNVAKQIGLENILPGAKGQTPLNLRYIPRWDSGDHLVVMLGPFAVGQDSFYLSAADNRHEDGTNLFDGRVDDVYIQETIPDSLRGPDDAWAKLVSEYHRNTLGLPSDPKLEEVGQALLDLGRERLAEQGVEVKLQKLHAKG